VRFDNVHLPIDRVLGTVHDGLAILEPVLDLTRTMIAAEMLGAMSQAFEMTIEYLKTRKQFDRLIGSFQALQHRAADLLGEIEITRSVIYHTLQAIDRNDPATAILVSVAKAIAGRAFHHVARETIQMHGGVGMTDEHDAGLFLKRAHAADMNGGNISYHRDRLARLWAL
jgi:alkylation response protein AidB-like acyl-CoA dehydrogenase